MDAATIIVSSMAISQFVFMAIHFLIHYRNTIGKLVGAFSLCTIAYLLNESLNLQAGSWTDIVLDILATLAPFFLWLIASLLFVDEKKQHGIAWLAIAACFALDFTGSVIPAPGLAALLVNYGSQLILLGFPLHAIYLAVRGYGFDLLEERRKFRIAFVTGLGTVVIFIVTCDILNDLLEEGLAGGVDPYVILASFSLFAVALAFNLGAIGTSDGALKIVTPNPAPSPAADSVAEATDSADQALITAIERAMQDQHLYREPGLTIADLAGHIGVLEYKARQTINKSMRYKNFNQFLNNYRIREACRLIRSTRFPVSRIAMDVGYSSLSAFNRAFKERMDTTPSDYRRQTGIQDGH